MSCIVGKPSNTSWRIFPVKYIVFDGFPNNAPQHPLNGKSLFQKKVSGIGGYPPTLGQHWLLKQFCLNHPVKDFQKPKLPKLHVRVETSTTYFIIHNQFVKNFSLLDQLFCSIFLKSPSRQQSYQIIDCK